MRRIRLVLVLLFLGLAVPVAILVQRALDGLAFESRLRHRSVAERAFDEMERELSSFLRAEEERPFEHYRFYEAEASAGSAILSPLARPPERPFVVGYFQIDPDGSIQLPERPRDLEQARRRGHWPPTPEVERAIARTEAIVRRYWTERSAVRSDALGQAPGSTLHEEKTRPAQSRELLAPSLQGTSRAAPDEGVSVYHALQKLNRALEDRAERRQKVAQAPYAAIAEDVDELVEPKSAAGTDKALPLEAGVALRRGARSTEPSAPAALADETVPVVLDPMVGRPLEGDLLLLYRSVSVAERSYRQGLVVDLAALGHSLDQRVLAPGPLRRVASASFFGPARRPPAQRSAAEAYVHRFAEPFDALAVRLELELPGVGTPTPIYALAVLVLVAGALGLFALDRMVAVVVQFAERRGNFVASVSHELKTPLTAIRMHAEMLRDDLVPSEARRREYYATISDESERLSRLIHNVLEFSNLERGKRDLQLAVGPVGPLLLEAAEKLEPHARRQGFTLRVEIEPDLPAVRMDRDAMLQMLFNLLDNAFKYARAAQRREVVLEARSAQGRVVVGVRDFGPGVASAHLRRVFEPFYRGEGELTRSAKGSGIGLALVRGLAERMGAAVRGGNAEGGGFRVEISLDPSQA